MRKALYDPRDPVAFQAWRVVGRAWRTILAGIPRCRATRLRGSRVGRSERLGPGDTRLDGTFVRIVAIVKFVAGFVSRRIHCQKRALQQGAALASVRPGPEPPRDVAGIRRFGATVAGLLGHAQHPALALGAVVDERLPFALVSSAGLAASACASPADETPRDCHPGVASVGQDATVVCMLPPKGIAALRPLGLICAHPESSSGPESAPTVT